MGANKENHERTKQSGGWLLIIISAAECERVSCAWAAY
jgi:hypothetical protein